VMRLTKCMSVKILPLEVFRPLEHPKTTFLSRDVAESLGLGVGDIAKISVGSRASVTRIVPAKDLRRAIALKYSLRLSLGVVPGGDAEICVEKVSPAKAERIVLRPETNTVRESSLLPMVLLVPSPVPPFVPVTAFGLAPIQKDIALKELLPKIKLDLKQLMLGAPYTRGDYVIWAVGNPFAEAEAVFRVIDTRPAEFVTVTNETDVEIEVPM